MGDLLGAAPPVARTLIDGVRTHQALGMTAWVTVDSVDLSQPDQERIVAFAIDQPRAGERFRGSGFEINGWVIGNTVSVRCVRTTSVHQDAPVYPLEVRRPDVAADYPAQPRAASSGFSAWAPVDPSEGDWDVTLEAVLENGDAIILAEFRGRTGTKPRLAPRGARAVTAPDFVIIGTQRGGTTSLHAYLSAHPQIAIPSTKELHFITDRYERGIDWYLGQFPAALSSRNTYRGVDALRALPPVGATSTTGDRARGKTDCAAAGPYQSGVFALPPGTDTR